MMWGMEILPFVTHGDFIFSILGFAAHREKPKPYFSSDEDFLIPKQFPDGILNSGSLWHQLGPIFRQKLWLVDSAVPLSSSVEVRKSASHNEIEAFDSWP